MVVGHPEHSVFNHLFARRLLDAQYRLRIFKDVYWHGCVNILYVYEFSLRFGGYGVML